MAVKTDDGVFYLTTTSKRKRHTFRDAQWYTSQYHILGLWEILFRYLSPDRERDELAATRVNQIWEDPTYLCPQGHLRLQPPTLANQHLVPSSILVTMPSRLRRPPSSFPLPDTSPPQPAPD